MADKRETTIDEFWAIFQKREELRLKTNTLRIYNSAIKRFKSAFPHIIQLKDVGAYEADMFYVKHFKKLALMTISNSIAALKTIWYKAMKWGYIDSNPFTEGVPKKIYNEARKKLYNDRRKQISTYQEAVLIGSIYECKNKSVAMKLECHLRILLGIQNGLRSTEAARIKWKDINLIKKTVKAQNPRHMIIREIPLTDEVTKLLEELYSVKPKPGNESLLGYSNPNYLSTWFRNLSIKAGFDFHYGLLRQTCAKRMAEASVSPFVAKRMLGHTTIATTQQYYESIRDQSLKDAVEKAIAHARTKEGIK
ncbi:tyrosine-type recombinase/integrase [Planctomycetota bacterium]